LEIQVLSISRLNPVGKAQINNLIVEAHVRVNSSTKTKRLRHYSSRYSCLFIILYYVPIGLWFSALVTGVRISLLQLVMMRIRKVPPSIIVRTMIEAHKAGLKDVKRDELEAHFLAGGHVEKVVHALVSASKANIDLTFKMATAIDLAGRDVFKPYKCRLTQRLSIHLL
jgi:uncharacterized protein YqfA (UPF0365 family)